MTRWVQWKDDQETEIEWGNKQSTQVSQIYPPPEPAETSREAAHKFTGRAQPIPAASIFSWVIGVIQIIVGTLSLVSTYSGPPASLDQSMESEFSTISVFGLCTLLIGGFLVILGVFLWRRNSKEMQ